MAGTGEIAALTGLRGIAACWVAAYHLHELDTRLWRGDTLLRHGYLAVDVFFVLSGFVMALSYKRMFASGTTRRAYLAFLLRRVARIYPLYIVMTSISLLFGLAHGTGGFSLGFAGQLVANILLVQSWGWSEPIDGPSWSVSTEVAAYLLFPVLLGSVFRGRILAATSCLVSVGVVIAASWQPTPPRYPFGRSGPLDIAWDHSAWPLIRCVAEFTVGLVAYRVAEARSRWFRGGAFGTAIPVLAVVLLSVRGTDLLFFALVPFLLLALLVERSPVGRLLASPPVLALGRWSYAIYLWHFLLFGVAWRVEAMLERRVPLGVAAALGELSFWLVLLLLAAASYRWVEVPGRALVRRWEARLFPREDRAIELSEAGGSPEVQRV